MTEFGTSLLCSNCLNGPARLSDSAWWHQRIKESNKAFEWGPSHLSVLTVLPSLSQKIAPRLSKFWRSFQCRRTVDVEGITDPAKALTNSLQGRVVSGVPCSHSENCIACKREQQGYWNLVTPNLNVAK